MEVWFTEEWLPGLRISCQVSSVVVRKKTRFQELCILDTVEFGRMLVLDNVIQTTEKDEYIYHESLVHVPMFFHPEPRRVLIIGGGDGGSLREVLRHPTVTEAVMVDIDGDVIEAAREHLPQWSSGFRDPRARLVVDDGREFLARSSAEYDVILVDSTDPVGPAEVLFEESFYSLARKALRQGGCFAAQTESPLATPDLVKTVYHRISACFPVAKLYTAPVPSYPGGWWSFTVGAFDGDPAEPTRRPDPDFQGVLRYYSPEIHRRAFVLPPKLVRDLDLKYRQAQD